ncbi:Ig-like domain-containing protein [Paenibacillus arenilitoris]|uniref:Ig-like domain-containing protein n=1 Tax=Paenibacillus arenilitoris TaxID=2772299 RepID=A0A927H6B7_9BACL|nr:Ig-like domain-containing protein [Paenibacillus arenilitoris]MBD2868399.1 Ig-like domain-containing protein [Paenibacillus arenilitoris]
MNRTGKLCLLCAVMLMLQLSYAGWGTTTQQAAAASAGPVVLSLSPADDLVNVPVAADMKLTFDENIVKGSSSTFISIYEYATSRLVESLNVTSSQVSIDASQRIVTINPTYDLAFNTDYYVLIDAGAFVNVSNGAGYAGLTNASSWNFRTVIATDATKPWHTGWLPVGNAVSITSPITVTFSEPVYAARGNIQVSSVEDVRTISVTSDAVRGSGSNAITIQPPAALQPNTAYTVNIPAGAIQDASGNIYDGAAWSFTTAAAPVNIATLVPADNATSVSTINPVLSITFDRAVQARTGKFVEIRRVSNNTTFAKFNALSSQIGVNGNTVTITPGSNFEANTAYYVLIEPGAFTQPDPYGDQWYHGIAGASIWNFSTDPGNESDPPDITAFSPLNNGTAGNVNTLLQMTFNEPVFPSNGNIEIRNAANDTLFKSIPVTSERVTGGGTYQITIDANKAITGEAAKPFVNETQYYVVFGSRAIRDAAGNFHSGVSSKNVWTFKVTQDTVRPTISSLSPVNQSTTVSENATFVATFSEPIRKGSDPNAVRIHQTGTNAPAPIVANYSVDPNDSRRLLITAPLTRATSYYISIAANAVTDLAGNGFVGILNEYQWTFKTVGSDTASPTVTKAESSGSKIKIIYNEELNAWLQPSPGSYYVSVNGAPRTVTAVRIIGDAVELTLESPIVNGQTVKLSYTKPDTGLVQDLTGNQAASLSNVDVTGALDPTSPVLTGGTAAGSSVTLIFNKALEQPNSYAYTQFIVNVGGTNYAATAISSNGASVYLSINGSIQSGQYVRVTYNPGPYPLRDTLGNYVNAISNYNLYASADARGPVLQSISASGSSVILRYDEIINPQSAPSGYQYTVFVDQVLTAVSQVSVSGDSVILTLSSTISAGQSVVVSYIAATNRVTDAQGNSAQSFQSVSANGSGSGSSNSMIGSILKGATLTLTFNEYLNTSSIPSSSLFFVKINEVARMVTKVEMGSTSVVLTLSSPAAVGDQATISYFSSSVGIKTNSGQLINSFTNVNVANQTSMFDGLTGDYEAADGGGVGLKTSAATASTDVSPAGTSATRYTIASDKFLKAYQTARTAGMTDPRIAFKVPSSERAAIVAIPVLALDMASRQGGSTVFAVQHGDVTYELPISAINYVEAGTMFNGSGITNHVLIEIDQGTSTKTATLMSSINGSNAQLIAGPVHYQVSIMNGTQERELTKLNSYVTRTIQTGSIVDPSQSSVVWYDPIAGSISYVPTTIATSGGRTTASFKRKGNSAYAFVRNSASFTDVSTHWAASAIHTLSRKFIVDGRGAGKFAPQSAITRGEFATYIAKGLGLGGDRNAAAKFVDVNQNTTMGAYIGAASAAGIVLGNTDGTFKPNAYISRQEMAVMMIRAAKAADVNVSLPSTASSYLSKFTDRGKISAYAQTDVAKAVYIGLMNGKTATTMSPLTNATRAEGAVMILRLLQHIKFISA